MELIQALRRLADVDDEWDDKARRFQQVRERLSDSETLSGRQAEHRARLDELAALRRELRDLELELESLQTRRQQVESDLYGGGVLAPRELENLRRDSEFLKRRIDQLEDHALDLMARVEDLEAVVAKEAAALGAFEREWGETTATAREEYAVLRARLEELRAERDMVRAEIPRRELALYDELRRSKGGRPLAPMVDRVCQICRVSVPSHKATIAEGGGEGVATCEGCGRILYEA
jgi:uncharacterized protein